MYKADLFLSSPNFQVARSGNFTPEGEETELKFCPICQLLSLPSFVKMPFFFRLSVLGERGRDRL